MKLLPRLIYQVNTFILSIVRPITIGVRLLPIRDNKVLLVKHTYQPEWYLIGGSVERGETLEQAARREAAEEVGATLNTLSWFGIYSNFYRGRSDHIAVFSSNDFTFTDKSDHEIESVRLFELDCLPDDISPGSQRRILEYMNGHDTATFGRW